MVRMTPSRRPLWDREATRLLRAVLSLRTLPEARRFMRDLMTEDEIRMIVDRWRVARLLSQGRSYREIEARHRSQLPHHRPHQPLAA